MRPQPGAPGLLGQPPGPRGSPRANRLQEEDAAVHRWYRFVLSFPPHLVRNLLRDFGVAAGGTVLDPFCGTGTTLVESRKLGFRAVGLEAMPMAHFATRVKTDWTPAPSALLAHAERVAARARRLEERRPGEPLLRLPEAAERLLIRNSISPLPRHRALALADAIREEAENGGGAFLGHERLALAKALVHDASNLRFGPEVGVGRRRDDAPVVDAWLGRIHEMTTDLARLRDRTPPAALVHLADARDPQALAPGSVDAVITSPPYPNEKDYSRTTRLETVFLGFAATMAEVRAVKQTLVRSNTRSVYRADEDDRFVADREAIQEIARAIEARRAALGKTSGFERNYHRVTLLYFGGMARHFAGLRRALKPGALLAYVVGDQASYFRVMIRTGELLEQLAASLGYEVARRDLFRTRPATATGEQLREEVLVLRWPGAARSPGRS